MNTSFSYGYRDAANYKQFEHLVLAGTFTATQLRQIAERLDGGEFFIPHQVGLAELQSRLGEIGEDDHVWHYIEITEIQPTAEPATPGAPSAAELHRRFMAVREWDVPGAMRRLGLE